jgi:hypothetical protein
MSLPTILTILPLALFIITPVILWLTRSRWLPWLKGQLDRHTEDVDSLPTPLLWLWISLAAGLGLYTELMIIRMHSSFFQLFAYFKNVSLLSCFLGLGIGYIRGARKPVMTPLVLPVLAFQIVIMYLLRFSRIADWLHNPISETSAFGFGGASELWHFITAYIFLIIIFALNAICFIPLGHLASRLMMRREKLVAYSWNLIGSLAGIVVFAAISFAWTPPWVWVLICAGGMAPFLIKRIKHLVPSIAATVVMLVVFAIPFTDDSRDIYSPYQILTVIFKDDMPPEIKACNTFHQNILDLREENSRKHELFDHWSTYYGMPYFFKPDPQEVLILGSGTGNDVAAAIRNGAGNIEAVEIDPAIMDCGIKWHPEEPYQSPKVNPIVDDARSHIKHTQKKYDLIVYGLVDSHSLLSGKAGGVRLDSYVYTVEGFRDAREKLAPDGLICLSFCVMKPVLGRKIFLMLQEAFDGKNPRAFQADSDASICFVIGEESGGMKIPPAGRINEITHFLNNPGIETDVSTDDWPFFYMAKRKYPVSYVLMIAILTIVSLLFVKRLAPGAGSGFSSPCFFLGAGFMLVETKSITELALVYGSTWMVISVVIAAILIMAFLANLLIIRIGPPRPIVTYSLLAVSLALGFGQSFIGFGSLAPWVGRLLMTVILTLPLFFSGFAFSSELKKSASVAIALSSNLLGAMLGGFLEYNAMFFGYRFLYILALIMYTLAFWGSSRSKKLA